MCSWPEQDRCLPHCNGCLGCALVAEVRFAGIQEISNRTNMNYSLD